MLEFAFKAAYIVEEKTVLGDYESELAKIYQFMEDNHAYAHLNNNYRDEWFMSLDKKKMLEKLKDEELREY